MYSEALSAPEHPEEVHMDHWGKYCQQKKQA
jgi:hypothetical protein